MRVPPILAVAFVLGAIVLGPTALACHGSVTGFGVSGGCTGGVCTFFYLVSSGGVGGSNVFALYQESNGIAGLQRGAAPILQGGYDECFVGGPKDTRVL